MKKIILGLFMSLMLAGGVVAQARYQSKDCRYYTDYYGQVWEQCRVNPYARYEPWHIDYARTGHRYNHRRHRYGIRFRF